MAQKDIGNLFTQLTGHWFSFGLSRSRSAEHSGLSVPLYAGYHKRMGEAGGEKRTVENRAQPGLNVNPHRMENPVPQLFLGSTKT